MKFHVHILKLQAPLRKLQVHTRKKFILEELPNSSETEDMRKIR